MATSSPTTISGDTRTIAALVGFSTVIGLVGHEVKVAKGQPTRIGYTEIIMGGGVAAVSLTLLSHAGDAGRSLAMGLAVITFTSSLLINGTTLAAIVTRVTAGNTGATKSAAAGTPSTPSTPSTPTGSARK